MRALLRIWPNDGGGCGARIEGQFDGMPPLVESTVELTREVVEAWAVDRLVSLYGWTAEAARRYAHDVGCA